jgi:cyclopropane fatty-acyl-phospholipid synthase-like methyltransferase
MTDPRIALVAAGYDTAIDTYESWAARIERDPRAEWCHELVSRLPRGARVFELGCGGGTAETRTLAERFRLTGVDLSHEQLGRARRRVPEAAFVLADFTELELEQGSVDAVASFYALNHVPRELLAGLFARIHGWLSPGGLLLTTLGAIDSPGWTGGWLGAPTFFSGFPSDTNRRLLAGAGFDVLRDEVVEIREPDGKAMFNWVLATR